ncbi:UBX domain-containing protein 1 isoform X2 [Agelaius tricolor]|uniref:UBX domain-containing protein 1 isoform X2 n=1 Tax=Agelaius tricolor TaxID=9191 RepID=UPI0039F1CC2D
MGSGLFWGSGFGVQDYFGFRIADFGSFPAPRALLEAGQEQWELRDPGIWGSGLFWGSGFGAQFLGVQGDLVVQDFGFRVILGVPGYFGFRIADFGSFPARRALSEAGQERERRRRGQELSKLREWRRDEERRRAAEERRRDRAEERAARQRVREKIERDKAERAQRFAPSPPNPPAQPCQEAPAPREYEECRIQVRLPDGRALTQSFRAREPLAAVRLFVELHRGPGGGAGGGAGGPPEPFSLRTAFPRRLFTEEDMEKPLQELGLVPSAVVIVAKKEGS